MSTSLAVKRHSIIADLCGTTRPGDGDGLVPYASAHRLGATSELQINAGHCCLEILDVIWEVARILKEDGPAGSDRLGACGVRPIQIFSADSEGKFQRQAVRDTIEGSRDHFNFPRTGIAAEDDRDDPETLL
jgi:hypothetical protein